MDFVDYEGDVIPSDAQMAAQRGWGGLAGAYNTALLGANIGLGLLHGALTSDNLIDKHKWLRKAQGMSGAEQNKFFAGGYDRYRKEAQAARSKVTRRAAAARKAGDADRARKIWSSAPKVISKEKFARRARLGLARKASGAVTGRLWGMTNFLFLAPMMYGMAYHGFRGIQRLGYQLERPDFGGQMRLPTAAFTDRQRAIQAMHNSEFNGRSAIGNEAGLYHR